jgi:hypothetical protein
LKYQTEELGKYLDGIIANGIRFNGMPINNLGKFLNSKGDSVELLEAVGDKIKVVINISELDCEVCVHDLLVKIGNTFKDWANLHILCVGTFRNSRDLAILLRSHNLNCDYIISNNGCTIPEIGVRNIPYLFTLNDSNRIENLFILNINYPNVTNVYIDLIYRKFSIINDNIKY